MFALFARAESLIGTSRRALTATVERFVAQRMSAHASLIMFSFIDNGIKVHKVYGVLIYTSHALQLGLRPTSDCPRRVRTAMCGSGRLTDMLHEISLLAYQQA